MTTVFSWVSPKVVSIISNDSDAQCLGGNTFPAYLVHVMMGNWDNCDFIAVMSQATRRSRVVHRVICLAQGHFP